VQAETIVPPNIKVSDGDTVRAYGERYRLVGFDTPETWSRRRYVSKAERALGRKARQRLKELIASGPVEFKEVPCACTKAPRREKQGKCRTNNRLCAVLLVDGKDVGRTLIAERLAREFVCTATECPRQLPWP
jgi:endonuclease YncB( thermonuclease family)